LPKEKICESSPIELQIVPYGQWTLSKPKERAELQPPLSPENPLMIFPPNNNERQHRRGGGSGSWSRQQQQQPKDTTDQAEEEDNDQWLSQVEILTHIGPHRRLWMGPQFSFKTLHPVAGGET
ncbi:Putative LOC100877372, partial [Caligus rogercresseyi]